MRAVDLHVEIFKKKKKTLSGAKSHSEITIVAQFLAIETVSSVDELLITKAF